MKFILKDWRMLTGLLAAINMGIMFGYILCFSSCRYLRGDIWGLDLKYLGIIFMAAVLVPVFLNRRTLCLALLSLGVGAEAYLVGYQVKAAVYCPFCLAFGAVLILMFVINFDKKKAPLMVIAALSGLLFLLFTFTGATTPAYAEGNGLTSFGSGPVKVRLYTDYFCAPCRAAEPEIESLLTKLLDKKVIRLTLIDTPVHKETPLYARYFLYILNHNAPTFSQALQARSTLYEAAGQNIRTAEAIETFLAAKNLKFKRFDVVPIFKTFASRLKEDNIQRTPSCVIDGPGGKKVFVGGADIIKALKGLLATK